MAGLIGMAQTLAVYHYGYYTFKDRTVQFHESKHVPSDAEAVLEWDLDTPFSSQDKPPLAIAMVVNAGDGYRSLLWLCASHNGSPVLVHGLRGSKMYFHQATKDRRILLIPCIHYFDAHRLQPLLLQAPALQVHMRESSLVGPEGADEQVDDLSSDEEQDNCK